MNDKSYSSNITLSEAVSTTTTLSNSIHPRRRLAENFLVIWMDVSIDQSKQDDQNILEQLSSVVSDVHIFTQLDECVDFLTHIKDTKVFLIVEDTVSQQIMPLVHDAPQLDTIYIFCRNKSGGQQWETKEWIKVKSAHTKITAICEQLQLVAKQYIQDTITVSFLAVDEGITSQNLNQLEPSFMYTQLFKEILLEIEYDEQSIKNFIQFWRQHYINNNSKLNIIAQFERDYSPQSSVWWYTREYFVFYMLNQALRTLEADTIITTILRWPFPTTT